ncbi:MAG: lipopolysaccharide biosynthesis protein [Candidatus Hodarchaeota archaeon]
MSEFKILLKQSSHYFTGRIFLMGAGLISFPILTRIFSVADYGILSLISTTLFIIIAIVKLGFPNAIVRFYAEFKAEKRLAKFYPTIFSGSLLAAAVGAALFFASIQLISDKFINKDIFRLLSLVSILIFTKSTVENLMGFLRAEQRTKLYNLIAIIRGYGSLVFSIFFVFFFVKGLYGFYVGQILFSFISLSILVYMFRTRIKIGVASFSLPLLKQSIKFGFPLVWAELGHLILNYADRYLILLYLSSTYLGLYTAGYNLIVHVMQTIIYPINYAMTPIYMNILVNKGKQQTKQFFSKLFNYFLLITLPSVFGLIAVGRDLIIFLASAKYAEAYLVLPYIVIGQAIYACTILLNSGLFIRKKTHVVTILMIITCILNIGLNIVLIPLFGIIGAAQATLVSYIFYTILITYLAFKEFSFPIHYERVFLYLVASLIMFIIINKINFGSHLFNLVTRVLIGATIYSILVVILDREIRAQFVAIGSKVIHRSHERLSMRN